MPTSAARIAGLALLSLAISPHVAALEPDHCWRWRPCPRAKPGDDD